MAKEVIVQVRMEKEMKEDAEKLYKSLGTSLSEAIRIFVSQSLKENGFPFKPTCNKPKKMQAAGLLHEYANPDLRKIEEGAFERAMADKHAKK